LVNREGLGSGIVRDLKVIAGESEKGKRRKRRRREGEARGERSLCI
jgi:hypothetical protein